MSVGASVRAAALCLASAFVMSCGGGSGDGGGGGGEPVDCVVSQFSDWTGGAWSQCVNNSQSRTETRTRTIVTQPANGGLACPALTETRTATQSCSSNPDSGLDARPNNLACVAPARTIGSSTLTMPRAFPNLTFLEPVAMLQAPGDNSRWFVVEQNGIVRVFANNESTTTSQVFLNITNRVLQLGQSEAGLLGLAFHPNFPATNRVYVNYTSPPLGSLRSITSEFTSPDGGLTLDPNSERQLLTVAKNADNHNGGQLNFGPDGFLYLGLGDGGGGGDPSENGQDNTILLGKMLRIDVNSQPGGQPYAIPGGATGNPFANNPRCNATGSGSQPCPEIYATGFRNPWRWNFDGQTLWLGDVGQSSWEEIDIVTRGGNYGWDQREGAHCFEPPTGCQTAGMIDPVAEYTDPVGESVTGGYVYRGSSPGPVGRFVFADFISGMIAHLTPGGPLGYTITQLVPPGGTPAGGATGPLGISSFGEAQNGDLYALDYFTGQIRRMVWGSGGGGGSDNVPTLLSQTGCINTSAAAAPPLLSLIPYKPNAQFWSDGAVKDRWIGLPNGVNIGVLGSGDWDAPNGTVFVKHFRLASQLIETRLFMKHPDGVWAGYTFQWNQGQTEATRVIGGATRSVGGQTWIYPSEAECMQCHTQAAGRSLGLETAQLNGNHTYPQTGRTANQITTLNEINVLTPPVAANPPAFADPSDTSLSLNARARAYLHTNCSNCHRPGGPSGVNIDLRHNTALSATNACNVAPTAGNLGIANALIIAPGEDSRSVLLARMARRGVDQMPPIASNVRDMPGEALISAWIDSLASCQ